MLVKREGREQHGSSYCTLIFLPHLELVYKFSKDSKEGLGVRRFAVLSKIRGSFGEFLHGSLLEGLQGLDCWVAVFQEVLHTLKSRDTSSIIYYVFFLCAYFCCLWVFFSLLKFWRIHSWWRQSGPQRSQASSDRLSGCPGWLRGDRWDLMW